MMFETRKCSTLLRRGPTALALASALLALAVAAGSNPAQALSPIKVYHSPSDDGTDPGPTCPPACSCPGGERIVNGDFETGDLSGWTVDDLEGGVGSFYSSSGTSTPISLSDSVGAEDGSFYAVSDQTGPGTHALSQRFSVPPNAESVVLSFDMFVNSWWEMIEGDGLDHTGDPNQFARVDIVDEAAFDLDPFTTDPAAVLANLYLGADPEPGEGSPNSYTPYSFDIASLGGGTFVLRFAETDNQNFFNLGVDNVSIDVAPECAFNLWIDGGPTPSKSGEVVCKMDPPPDKPDELRGGSGDELCGADVLIELTSGPGSFTHFNKDSERDIDTLVHYPDCVTFDSETGSCSLPASPDPTVSLRMNFRRGDSDPLPVPRRLGTLMVGGADFSGTTELTVSYVEAAGANLQLRSVPEPGQISMLVSGLLGLCFLYRLRRRP